jgi:hypothetical protein
MGKSIPHRVRDVLVQIKDLKQCALRPEMPAGISEKTENLLLGQRKVHVSDRIRSTCVQN